MHILCGGWKDYNGVERFCKHYIIEVGLRSSCMDYKKVGLRSSCMHNKEVAKIYEL